MRIIQQCKRKSWVILYLYITNISLVTILIQLATRIDIKAEYFHIDPSECLPV